MNQKSNVQNLHIPNSDKPVTLYPFGSVFTIEEVKRLKALLALADAGKLKFEP